MSDFYYGRHVEREILSALLDGELDADHRRYVHEHLQACDACREVAEEFGAIKGAVSELPRLVAPEAFVSRALQPRARRLPRRAVAAVVRGRRRYVVAGIAAVAVGVTLAGLVVDEPAAQPPTDVLVARHISVHDGMDAVGQVLFAVRGE